MDTDVYVHKTTLGHHVIAQLTFVSSIHVKIMKLAL